MRALRKDLRGISIGGEPLDSLLVIDGLPIWRFFSDAIFSALGSELRRHIFAREAGLCSLDLPSPDGPPEGGLGAVPIIYALEERARRRPLTGLAKRPAALLPPAEAPPILYFSEFETEHLRAVEPISDIVTPEGPLALLRGWSWRSKALKRPGRWSDLLGPESARRRAASVPGVDLARVRQRILLSLGIPSAEAEARLERILNPATIARAHSEATRLEEILGACSPRVIFGHQSHGVVSGILDYLAARSKLPFVKLVHYDCQLSPGWEGPLDCYGTKLLVLTDADRGSLVARGADPGTVLTVGYPSFDAALSVPRSPPVGAGELINVLWAAQGSGAEIEIGQALVRASKHNPRLRLVVRKHPNGLGLFIDALVRGAAEISTGRSLIDDLDRSEIVVCRSSIVAVQAILRDKPVIIVEPRLLVDNDLHALATERSAAVLVTDLERLGEALLDVASNESLSSSLAEGRARFLADYLDGREGGGVSSSRAIAEVLSGLTHEGAGDRSNE